MNQKRIDRRKFLKKASGIIAAGSVIPYFCTSSQARAQLANDPFGIAAIGVGVQGSRDAKRAGNFGNIVACCDVDTAQANRFAEKIAVEKPAIYQDYRRALEHPGIDIVTIGTPDHWHTAILLAALKAGKDVYCQKPMTLTIDEGKLICKAVRETGCVVQVGTQQRTECDQVFLKAVAIVRSGRLGNSLTLTCGVGNSSAGGPFPTTEPPATLNWDLWLGQASKVPYCVQRTHKTFRWYLEYSGGKMTDWGAHHLDIAQWALGADNTGPVEIEGAGEFPLGRERTLAMLTGEIAARDLPNAYNAARNFRVLLKYDDGNKIVVTNEGRNGILIEGEKGRIFVNRDQLVGRPVEEIAASEHDTAWLNEEVVKLYKGKQPTSHMENFVDCVRNRETPISDVWTHHRAVSLCHLSNIAMLVGRKLNWDPAKEDFVGDTQASALLSKPQRPPYTIEV